MAIVLRRTSRVNVEVVPRTVAKVLTKALRVENAACPVCDGPIYFSDAKWLHCPKCGPANSAEAKQVITADYDSQADDDDTQLEYVPRLERCVENSRGTAKLVRRRAAKGGASC